MATQLSTGERCLIERLCKDYRDWAPAERSPPQPVELRGEGHNHRIIILKGEHQRWVLRLGSVQRDTDTPAAAEYRLATAAAAAGIGPRILVCDPGKRLLLMEHLDADRSGSVAELADLLRAVHRLPAQGRAVTSSQVLERYRSALDRGHPLESILTDAEDDITAALTELEHNPPPVLALCHNDLLRANRRRRGTRLAAIDWEYAAPGDPYFDIAVCASELKHSDAAALLSAYLERAPLTTETRRFEAQSLVYRCIEACWFAARATDRRATQRSVDQLTTSLHRWRLA